MPKITLFALNSSYVHTNLAVRCIKKALVSEGFTANILEFSLKDKRRRVLEALISQNADIYGFSAYIWNITELYSFASDLKKLRPDATIVFGGPEVSFDSEEILKDHPYIDCIIKGEGEDAFCSLAKLVRDKKPIPHIIDGGIFEDFKEQGMLYSPHELQSGTRVVYYESSRGCPYRCAYCLSSLSGEVRAKSADVTLNELLEFEAVDNIKVIKFVDRTFNFDRERAKAIWRGLLSDKYTKNYHFEICADLLDEESFLLLSGFPKEKIQLEIGVQSTNPDTLREVSRRPETDKLIGNIKRLYEMGNMHIHADLIAGLPREDMESFARSFEAVYGKCHILQLGFLKLLHGSALRRDAKKFGCIFSDTPPYTVLATDCMSFGDLAKLHTVDDLLDRYCTGAFNRTLKLLTSREDSPFGLFLRLAKRFESDGVQINAISQPAAYEKLYQYLSAGDDRALAECLLVDFLTSEKLSPPKIGGYELVKCNDGTNREFMKYADLNGIEYFAPALETRLGSKKYVIDRRNMRAFLASGSGFIEI